MGQKTEEDLIRDMQRDTAYIKRLLNRINGNAAKVVTINHEAGRYEASADAMKWHSAVQGVASSLNAAHAEASRALVAHYGEKVMIAAGPWR